MKSTTRLLTHTSLLLTLVAPCLAVADEASKRQQVETLFRLTQMEAKIQESVDSVVQLQLQQNPGLQDKRKELEAFMQKYIGWPALKEDIAGMYMETFSEQELEQINDFYITPTGQKVINTVPQLVQKRNQLAMQRLQQHIGELQAVVSGKPPEQ